MELIRIEKYLSQEGIASRREAKELIEKGLVSINGKKAVTGQKITSPKDNVTIIQEKQEEKITVAVYKPRGVLSSHDEGTGKNIFQAFPQYQGLNTVGRLDKESEGLILLSNDGLVTKAVTGSHHPIEKEYLVTTREEVLPWMMERMSKGMELEDGWTLPASAKKTGVHSFKIILREGRKHQIRRMANACKLTIESLKRIRIHTIKIDGMMPGNVKKLSAEAVDELKRAGNKK